MEKIKDLAKLLLSKEFAKILDADRIGHRNSSEQL